MILLQIFGIAGVGLIVWILVDQTIPLHFAQEQGDFMIAAIIYLIVAILLILLSLLGIYSVSKEVRWAVVVVSNHTNCYLTLESESQMSPLCS